MADQSGGLELVMMREYRKGNWTLNETMVLIEAKKMDDARRMRRSIGLPAPEQQQDSRSSSGNKPAELRWKWIEDYCWRKGCMRSQNQCNDKWDNLMRDYKKVREYERRRVESSFASESSSSSAPAAATETPSYWKMEKSERKERNLPSNMLPQTYQALYEVVESKTLSSSSSAAAATASAAVTGSGNGSGSGQIQNVIQQSLGFAPNKHQIIQTPVILPLPQPPPPFQTPPQPLPRPLMLPPPQPQPQPQPLSFRAQPILPTRDSSSSESDTNEYSDTSPAKRRKTMPATTATAGPSGGGGNAEAEETTMGDALSMIANAIRESEERQDKRHKEMMSLQERRLRIEETNVEMNRQGMNGLVEAINKLATSIYALASSSTSTSRQNNQRQGGPQ